MRKVTLHENYKYYRNKIVTLIRLSKKNHYQNYFKENLDNIKKTWNGIKQIINISNKIFNPITSMYINNNISNDQTKIANHLNTYFSTIGTKIQNKIFPSKHLSQSFLKNPNPNSFFIKPTNGFEISTLISNFSNNKAYGPFSIPIDIFKLIKNNVSQPLASIINISFSTGIYPDNLKRAQITPTFKNKGSLLSCDNYRPISLLSNINKIFEKLFRLYQFLNINNCIYELQFGFRKNHSTNHALFSITEKIREALDQNNFSCGIFIDLQKAFDTVDKEILLHKLSHYGIRGIANSLFRSYLSNRKQFVSINGFESEVSDINIGVPQGSVLGPLLF